MHLEPAKTVIEKIGGADAVAKVTGRDVSRVYRWMYPRERGGTGGVIPHPEARKLLEHAAANDIALAPGDFFAAPATSSPGRAA